MADAILPMPPYKWQSHIWQDFTRRVENDSVPHAFLLSAEEGYGAEALAVAMGQYLLCLSPTDNLVCGRCKACLLLDAGTHPDLLSVVPEEKGKQIKVDQVRQITDFVAKTAQQGGRKIIVLYPAEAMNVNAANALLKNLEEPAGSTVFILVTTQLSRLLPTIRSRCAMTALPVPEKTLARQWLNEAGIETDAQAEALLAEFGGAPLLVKEWFDSGALQEREQIVEGLHDMMAGSLEPMMFAKKWANSAPLFVLGVMLSAVDAAIRSNMAAEGGVGTYVALIDVLKRKDARHLFMFREKLCTKKAQLLGPSNLNAAMVVEELTLDWIALLRQR